MTIRTVKRRTPPPIVFFILGIILFVSVPHLWSLIQSKLPVSISAPVSVTSIGERMSLGEHILFPNPNTHQFKAVAAFSKDDYRTAVENFQASLRQNPNDPETRIYLNNVAMGISPSGELRSNRPSFRIAVSVPIGSNPNVAQEILRGVAQAQHEVNQQGGLHSKGLQVQIANDDNNPEAAKQIADTFVHDPGILAVIGHNASNASVAAAPIYQQGGLVMITPTSFANLLSNFGSYIFRTVPNIRSMAAPLAEYVVQQKQLKNIAICYDSLSPDNVSFRDEFVAALTRLGGQQTDTICDFASQSFNPALVMNEIRNSPAEGILLAPFIDRINQAIALAQVNQQGLPLYGSTTLYTMQTLQQGGKDINGLVLPVPWFPTEPFASKARQLWKGSVNWRTASAYDATKAVIASLQQNTNRAGLQQVLRSPNFAADGASGKVQFLATGDRVSEVVLVEAVVDSQGNRFSKLQQ
jgi:branched-chain amino acid transport system substrate-binding protein